MPQEVFVVRDRVSPHPEFCTMSPSKAYKKARELWGVITIMSIDSDPCSVVRYVDLDDFYERYC